MAATWSKPASALANPWEAAHRSASVMASQAPVTAAVRVPPSAWITSQSTRMAHSPMVLRFTTDRSDRPISREISSALPFW